VLARPKSGWDAFPLPPVRRTGGWNSARTFAEKSTKASSPARPKAIHRLPPTLEWPIWHRDPESGHAEARGSAKPGLQLAERPALANSKTVFQPRNPNHSDEGLAIASPRAPSHGLEGLPHDSSSCP